MATIRPFRALRPLPEYASRVASKPYDVLSSKEARIEAAGEPLSFLHVGKPEIDLPLSVDPYDPQVYEKGKENLQRLIKEGILRQDPNPYFYLYAQTMGEHTQYGIVGCVAVEEYLNDTIKKHELTRPDKENDRTKHVEVTNAHTGPIFLIYRSDNRIDAVVDRICFTKPANDFVADDSVRHQLWVISHEETIQSVTELFKEIKTLYVADGHHRAAAAVTVAKQRAAANPHHTGKEEYNYFLSVLFSHNQVRILPYNRTVRDLNGRVRDAFLREIEKSFEISRSRAEVEPAAKGELGMYLQGSWCRLTVKPHLLTGLDPLEQLDVALLQNHLLGPLLGIEDPRIDDRIDFIGGIRGVKELTRRVDSGDMAVAFALYPTSIEELLTIADAGKFMPPKSTWFEPKLRDGLVVHPLD